VVLAIPTFMFLFHPVYAYYGRAGVALAWIDAANSLGPDDTVVILCPSTGSRT